MKSPDRNKQFISNIPRKLPFKDLPSNCSLNNNKSARDNPDLVKSEIENLLILGCISEVSEKPYVVIPLTVAYGNQVRQDWCLIIDT